MVFVHQGCFWLHGRFRIEDPRERFIGYLDELQGFSGGVRVRGGHRRDLVAVGPDLTGLQGRIVLVNPPSGCPGYRRRSECSGPVKTDTVLSSIV